MSADHYVEVLRATAPLNTRQLSTVHSIIDHINTKNARHSSMAPWLFVYRPTRKSAPVLLNTLLKATEVLPRVPLSRIELSAGNRHSFALLVLSDSPVYVACPPREAREGNSFINPSWRGLNLLEGLWFTLAYPSILNERALDLVGAMYSIECTPTIYQWAGQRYLSAIAPDSRDEMCRPVLVRKTLRIDVKELDQPAELERRVTTFARHESPTPMF